ncbi:pilus assembly protein PilM [Planctomycetota bacterium]
MTDAIAKRLSIDFGDAEILKRNPADRLEEIKEYTVPVFDDLANEVRLCFDYFENQYEQSVEEIYLSGGAAMMMQITDILGPVLEKPVNLWSPIENMQVDASAVDVAKLKQNAPQLTIAMGLASRLLG